MDIIGAGMDAFETLVRSNGARILTLATHLTGDFTDGQRLAKETFLEAERRLAPFRREADTTTGLTRLCLTVWKSHKNTRANAGPGLEDRLAAGLSRLPADVKVAFLLRELEKCGDQQIAWLMDIPVAKVSELLAKARGRLHVFFLQP